MASELNFTAFVLLDLYVFCLAVVLVPAVLFLVMAQEWLLAAGVSVGFFFLTLLPAMALHARPRYLSLS